VSRCRAGVRPRCEHCSGSKRPVGLSTHRGDHDLVGVPVPRPLYANDDAPTPLAARNELRTLKASIPAQLDDIARFKLEDAHGAARLHVREHPLWGAKAHGLSHVQSIKEVFRPKRDPRCSPSIALLSQLTPQMRRYLPERSSDALPIATWRPCHREAAATAAVGSSATLTLEDTAGRCARSNPGPTVEDAVNHQTSDALVAISLHDAPETESFPVPPAASSRRIVVRDRGPSLYRQRRTPAGRVFVDVFKQNNGGDPDELQPANSGTGAPDVTVAILCP
jgi:hypothetical protein